MAESYKDLIAMSEEQLIQSYDAHAPQVQIGLNFIREEISRRQHARESEMMLTMTRQMRNMTKAITAMTIVILILTALNLIPLLKTV